jgi:hypothetical protein
VFSTMVPSPHRSFLRGREGKGKSGRNDMTMAKPPEGESSLGLCLSKGEAWRGGGISYGNAVGV